MFVMPESKNNPESFIYISRLEPFIRRFRILPACPSSPAVTGGSGAAGSVQHHQQLKVRMQHRMQSHGGICGFIVAKISDCVEVDMFQNSDGAWEKGPLRFKLFVWIPPTRFELVSPDPKSCMIDRYTTGVFGNAFTKFDTLPFLKRRYY